jgi:hypothetical protein
VNGKSQDQRRAEALIGRLAGGTKGAAPRDVPLGPGRANFYLPGRFNNRNHRQKELGEDVGRHSPGEQRAAAPADAAADYVRLAKAEGAHQDALRRVCERNPASAACRTGTTELPSEREE